MRQTVICAALLFVVVLVFPSDGVAQQSPATIAAAARPPSSEPWTAQPRNIPRIPARPCEIAPTIQGPGQTPPVVADINTEDDGESAAAFEEHPFLVPVVFPGFWAMPPGGLTRFLWQPPVPINPESTLGDWVDQEQREADGLVY